MRVYRERLRVPALWWPAALALVALFGTELVAGLGWLLTGACFLLLAGLSGTALALAGRTVVEVTDRELRAGRSRLPLDCAGEVAALDEAQTRLLRGPRADPRAVVRTRPFLRRAVYIGTTAPCPSPYWLVGTRHPEALAAAIGQSRAADRPGGVPVG